MEQLLHYTWRHRLYPANTLTTADGEAVDVIDPGLHNNDAGPDFLNAKVRIGPTLWAGHVEIHERASDWYRHGHEKDAAYNNTVLHVCGELDAEAVTQGGQRLPQVRLEVPAALQENYAELLAEERYPPCYRVVPQLSQLVRHSWLSALTVERLAEKTARIADYFHRTGGSWEWTLFVTLARNFGFGVNSETFEAWALRVNPAHVGRHRDNLEQVEAYFLGQAGLLAAEAVSDAGRSDAYYLQLCRDYRLLRNKFSLQPLEARHWRFLRMRPHNFPHVRLSQLAWLFHQGQLRFDDVVRTTDMEVLRSKLRTRVTPYWECHTLFGRPSATVSDKQLSAASLDLLIINTVAPLLFAYGRECSDEECCERAIDLLEQTAAERNFITRSWAAAGIHAQHAADSQALIQLKRAYCDRKDCLRCRFGAEYLRRRGK